MTSREEEAIGKSLRPSAEADTDSDMDVQQLRETIKNLRHEVATLHRTIEDKDALHDVIVQLRDANQNLVMAAVNAQTLRDEAQASNRRQNEFLAMLAHELRNPLAPIGMAATLLKKMAVADPSLLKLQVIINRQVEHMAHLLDDLLDAARISNGKITLLTKPVQLSEIVERAIETVQPRIDERWQRLSIDVPAESIIIDGDQVRLAQVFSNLLVNASKFTQDHGHITFAVKPSAKHVVVTVGDDGQGISPDVMPHIFDLFTQGPRSLARSEGGLGIGLSVVRNLVHMHGGTIEARSMGLGSGSLFTVTLPVADLRQSAAPAQVQPADTSSCYRILLVEDNVDASDTLKSFLTLEGHTVNTAYDGPTGLAMASENSYEIVICDIGLPGLDGFDMIKELRRRSVGSDRPFIIAVSGYGQPEDRTRAVNAGFDHYLVKPVDAGSLLSFISSKIFARQALRAS